MPDPAPNAAPNAATGAAAAALSGAPVGAPPAAGTPGAGDGGDWAAKAGFSEDFRKAIAGDNYADMGAFEKGVLGQKELLGRRHFVMPGKDAKPEEWDKVYEQWGRPKDAKEYQFAPPKDYQFTDYDAKFQDHMRPFLHRAGMAPRQLEAITEGVAAWNAQELKSYTDTQTAEMAAVQKEWGAGWDANLVIGRAGATQLARLAFGEKGTPDQVNNAIERMMGSAATLRIAHALGQMLKEPAASPGQPGQPTITTPQQARARIDEIRAEARKDTKHPFHHPMTAEGKKLAEELERLYAMLPAGG